MELSQTDIVVFVYTLGVMASAFWLSHPDPSITPFIAVTFTVVALGWTLYFNWKIAPQFVEDDEDQQEEESATALRQE